MGRVRGCALLFDLASLHVLSHTKTAQLAAVIDAYWSERPRGHSGLRHLDLLVRLRWSIQAWYFAWRLINDIDTGGAGREFNEAGWLRSKEALVTGSYTRAL